MADESVDTKQIYDLLETGRESEIAQTKALMSPVVPVPNALERLHYLLVHLPTSAMGSTEKVQHPQFFDPTDRGPDCTPRADSHNSINPVGRCSRNPYSSYNDG